MKTYIILFCMAFFPQILLAKTSQLSSRIEIKVSHKKSQNNTYIIFFKALAKDGLILNLEAPWKLSIESNNNLKALGSDILTIKDFDPINSGFRIEFQVSKNKNKNISVKIDTFTCTKDKKRCFRDQVLKNYSITENN